MIIIFTISLCCSEFYVPHCLLAIKGGSYLLKSVDIVVRVPLQQCKNIADCWSLMSRSPPLPGFLIFTDKICRLQEEGWASNKRGWGVCFHWASLLQDWCSGAGLIHYGRQCWDGLGRHLEQKPRIYQFRVLQKNKCFEFIGSSTQSEDTWKYLGKKCSLLSPSPGAAPLHINYSFHWTKKPKIHLQQGEPAERWKQELHRKVYYKKAEAVRRILSKNSLLLSSQSLVAVLHQISKGKKRLCYDSG